MPENTIRDDLCGQVSPVKMVGLMRPSTIIEETASQSIMSRLGAGDGGLDSSLSSVYETAQEGTNSSYGSEEVGAEGNELLSTSDQDEDVVEDTVIEIDSDDDILPGDNGEDIGEDAPRRKSGEMIEADCDKENRPSFVPMQTADILDESLHLNDTWEEMDYLLRKCLECKANCADVPPNAAPAKQTEPEGSSQPSKPSAIPVRQSIKTKNFAPLLSPKPVVKKGRIGWRSE